MVVDIRCSIEVKTTSFADFSDNVYSLRIPLRVLRALILYLHLKLHQHGLDQFVPPILYSFGSRAACYWYRAYSTYSSFGGGNAFHTSDLPFEVFDSSHSPQKRKRVFTKPWAHYKHPSPPYHGWHREPWPASVCQCFRSNSIELRASVPFAH